MTKAHLRDELARILAGELKILTHAQAQTQHAATHEEAKPENDKDTRALEQSYLARGQAQRVESLRAELAAVAAMPIACAAAEQPIAMGSWICLASADDGKTMQLYLAPAGGGISLQGQSVHVVTPQAPFGRAILGKKTGDDLEVMIAGKVSGFTIVSAKWRTPVARTDSLVATKQPAIAFYFVSMGIFFAVERRSMCSREFVPLAIETSKVAIEKENFVTETSQK